MAGLALIVVGYLRISQATPFPGMAALIPTIGAGLIIYGGMGGGGIISKLLSLQPIVFLGRISYSLYLVHWPVIVLGKRAFPLMSQDRFILSAIATSLLLAYVSYRFIEQPFRKASAYRNPKRTLVIAVFAMGVSISLGLVTVAKDGLYRPQDPRTALALSYLNYNPNPVFETGKCFMDLDLDPRKYDLVKCLPTGPGSHVLLWGDSHAANLVAGLRGAVTARGDAFGFISSSACPPEMGFDRPLRPYCRPFNDIALSLVRESRPNLVVLAALWLVSPADLARLGKTIADIQAVGARVVVLGPQPDFKRRVPMILADRISHGLPPYAGNEYEGPGYGGDADKLLRNFVKTLPNVTYISMEDLLCPDGKCKLANGDGVPLYFDIEHLTDAGAKAIAEPLAAMIFAD
jgi:hypothetical protein